MKLKTTIFGLLLTMTIVSTFSSCSPQSLDDLHEEQNIDKDSIRKLPTRG